MAIALFKQARNPFAVAAILVEDVRDLPAAFLWAEQVDIPEMWRYVGLAQAAAYRTATVTPSTGPSASED